ncbi:hypothetical protein WAE56_07350 [Iodobacter sp. LRB]|uniref:hypothetical protein n=1 Tax=unclassified Iodobacter TaxID=235634 RepID=UPI000C111215|nr:hypothetical protein [Iodobacter sp. BJB302]PHV02328.1 hypothetical protein CSQ88_07290 [Iodobacter sp. BJB302]
MKHDLIPGGASTYVLKFRMDLSIYVEENDGEFPPAMFASRIKLEEWTSKNNFSIKKVGKKNSRNYLLMKNEYLSIDFLWVRASFISYRALFKRYVVDTNIYEKPTSTPDESYHKFISNFKFALPFIHADHVINQARLKKNHPDAWVMLFPTSSAANSSFGSKVEKTLADIPENIDKYFIDPILLLQLYCTGLSPKNEVDLQRSIDIIKGHFLNRLHNEIDKNIRAAYISFIAQ